MKTKLLLLTTILVSVFCLNAEAARTELKVSSYDNAPIVVFVDGAQYGPYTNVQNISNLYAGVHQMKVIALYTRPYGFQSMRKVIYSGPVNIADGFEVRARVMPNYQLRIDDMVSLAPQPGGYWGAQPVNGGGHGHNDQVGDGYLGNGYVGHVGDDTGGNCTGPVVAHPVHNPPPTNPIPVGPVAVPDYDFNQMLHTIQAQSFESTKMNITRQLLSQHYFTARQVERLMNAMSFESSRLEIAQLAYQSTVDPYNYYQVYDAFAFESSIVELNRYISSIS